MKLETFEKLVLGLGFEKHSWLSHRFTKGKVVVAFFDDLSNGQVIIIHKVDRSKGYAVIEDFKKVVHFQREDEDVIKCFLTKI